MKRILLIALIVILVAGLVFTSKYAIKYAHWSTKSLGYPGLYKQTDRYSFLPLDSVLVNSTWELLAMDSAGDGDLLNWPDVKALHVYRGIDTIWLAYSLHNDIDINAPMVSIALHSDEGRDWYGTLDLKYKGMISTGYYRKGDQYYGYNFLIDEKGICSFKYNMAKNALYMGIPKARAQEFKGKKFVASVGLKSYWNDDVDQLIDFDSLLK